MDVEDRSVFELPYEKPDETFTFGKSEDQVIDFYLPPDQKKTTNCFNPWWILAFRI